MPDAVQYIGGPLDGQTAHRDGDHWTHFRDDNGQPLDTAEGDAEFSLGHGQRRRHYYLASTPGNGWAYVHLTVIGEWWPDGFPHQRGDDEPRL